MPARKSHDSEEGATVKDGLSVEDLLLPRTMCQRLAKGVLPANTQIQKDALLAMSKSATVFINYIGMHAQDAAQAADKSTIRPKDVLEAIKELEFEDFIPRLEIELEKYNTEQCNKRNTYRRQKREEKAAADVKAATQAAMTASDAARASDTATPAAANGLDSSVLSHTLDSSGYDLEGAGDRSLATDVDMDLGGDGRGEGEGRPPSKKVRMSGGANGEAVRAVSALEDEGVEDGDGDEGEGMEEDEEEEGEGEGEEVEEEEDEGEELREDPLEEVEGGEEDEDEVLDDEEESD